MKKLAAAFLAAVFVLAACGDDGSSSSSEAPTPGGSTHRTAVQSSEVQFAGVADGATTVTMETSSGTIRFVLYPEYAPLAVENFCTLAQQGYYDGTGFHRIVNDFIIQGGDGTGTGGESIWGIPFHTERSNYLRHYSGALCMAAADGESDTHLSQFYIVATPAATLDETLLQQLLDAGWRQAAVDAYAQAGGAPHLDNVDTVFGQVIEGMDIVDKIAATSLDDTGAPRRLTTITSVTVNNYPPTARAAEQPAADAFVASPMPEDLSVAQDAANADAQDDAADSSLAWSDSSDA